MGVVPVAKHVGEHSLNIPLSGTDTEINNQK